MQMRIMAIDYGDQRIGIAISDLTGSICGEAFTMEEWDMDRAVVRISEEAGKRNTGKLVLGLPRNMDGSMGPRAQKTLELQKRLEEESGLPVVLWDERRTTIDAVRILKENGRFGKKRKEKVDAVAASLILEGYLGSGLNE